MFDRDSDNDDCNDVIEADFTSLSNFEEMMITMVFMGLVNKHLTMEKLMIED